MTSTPGWSSNVEEFSIVQGKLGAKWWNAYIQTPDLYVGGSDQVTISMRAETDSNSSI